MAYVWQGEQVSDVNVLFTFYRLFSFLSELFLHMVCFYSLQRAQGRRIRSNIHVDFCTEKRDILSPLK